jgi:hypothetical protein
LRHDEENSALPWLPKKSTSAQSLDAVQKPYYCGSKFKRQCRLAATALLGLAPVCLPVHLPLTTGKASALAGMMTWV